MAKGVPAVWEGEGVNSGTGRAYGDGDGAGADCGNAVADALKLRASVCCRCSVAAGSQAGEFVPANSTGPPSSSTKT
ncbi:hypothetical protein OsI_20334 [Oryza sativa Indica Group]|uniref:Uncharacterized protein n=2 Tax=Oryza sativa TaxID=4530 RepID=B9FKS0_ORYSJ|nr:hypothetical protein OsI_20334 [Oryza sativa Indica Group]EEE64089.1 hypothetical protein OsJ_18920 [Oryza sativa Japonica Group]